MISKIKKMVSDVKEQYKAMCEVRNIFRMSKVLGKITINHNGTITAIICYDPTYLKAFGFKLAACFVTNPNEVVVCVDDLFNKLDADSQSAVIFHEIGHYINNDYKSNIFITNIKRMINIYFNRCDSKELKADLFAAQNTTPEIMIKALYEIKTLIKDDKIQKEMDLRLNAIKKVLV
jgi:Zn-dependent protease with chaperone function